MRLRSSRQLATSSAVRPPPPTLQSAASPPALDFFFKVCCACRSHPRLKRILCLSSLGFFVAAHRLFSGGIFFQGGSAAALGLSSVVYHATHSPGVRAADVLLLWFTGSLGVLQSLAAISVHGPNAGLVTGLSGVGLLCAIFAVPYFYVDGDVKGEIRLHWHATVHLVAAASLFCMAIGFQPPGTDAEARAIHARQWQAWRDALACAMALMLATYALHASQPEPDETDVCTPCDDVRDDAWQRTSSRQRKLLATSAAASSSSSPSSVVNRLGVDAGSFTLRRKSTAGNLARFMMAPISCCSFGALCAKHA